MVVTLIRSSMHRPAHMRELLLRLQSSVPVPERRHTSSRRVANHIFLLCLPRGQFLTEGRLQDLNLRLWFQTSLDCSLVLTSFDFLQKIGPDLLAHIISVSKHLGVLDRPRVAPVQNVVFLDFVFIFSGNRIFVVEAFLDEI